MFIMYDDVTLDLIPNGPHAVLAYPNGRYANLTAARERFPHARILPMSVEGMIACDGYDIEHGDYTAAQVPELYRIAKEAGIWRPCFYAQLSGVMPAVRAELGKVISKRSDVRLMVAYYNGQPDLPSEYDAHQFTDRALGRSLDESICASDFFPPLTKPKPKPTDEVMRATAEIEFHPGTKTWGATIHG
jgi:hypothetical protein